MENSKNQIENHSQTGHEKDTTLNNKTRATMGTEEDPKVVIAGNAQSGSSVLGIVNLLKIKTINSKS